MLRQRLAMWLSFVNKLTVRRSQITKRMCSTTLAPPSSLLTDYKNTDAKNQFYSSPVQVDLDLLTKFTPENLKVLRKDLSSRGVNCDLDKTVLRRCITSSSSIISIFSMISILHLRT